jgi:ketosteroid isomerase-like protein
MQTTPLLRFVCRMKFLLPCLLFVAAVVRAETCNPQETAKTILDLEARFYQTGQEQGARVAFLTYLGDDAIGFEPEPVNAKKLWEARSETSTSFKWQPLFVGVSQSCDLAYTTGPSELRRTKTDEKPFAYGQYVTIWKKRTDGEWKVAVDLGGAVPGPRKVEEAPEITVDYGEAPSDDLTAAKKLRQAEKWFIDTAATDSTGALVGSSSPHIRVHRGNVFPAYGREPATLMLSVRRGSLKMERLGGAISAAKDFAYSYGKYTLEMSQTVERGHYLQIWRTLKNGEWRLVLDHQTPLPEKPAR